MTEDDMTEGTHESGRRTGRQPYRVRLPGFVSDQQIGVGEVVKRVTSTLGVVPCSGCERRAAIMNRWLVFSGKKLS